MKSWIESANVAESDFPLENLPFGVFSTHGTRRRIGVAIGDSILDLYAAGTEPLFDGLQADLREACQAETLNALMALGEEVWSPLRARLIEILGADAADDRCGLVRNCLVPMRNAEMHLPAAIGDYTDFFTSLFHAENAGKLFRPDNPLWPNYKYVPIGYHGRASSIVVSGVPVRRPNGQRKFDSSQPPAFGPCRALDYEMEVGFFIGPGNTLGEPVSMDNAKGRIFGACLLNDWSARDIQSWEYQPLGPFLAKSFATSISPWVVTMEALQPFRVPALARPEGDPTPLPYLNLPGDQALGGIDLKLEVWLTSEAMRAQDIPPMRLSQGNYRDMYWTVAQLVAHHTSNGCNLRPGDLLGSGTVSGRTPESVGCLLERTKGGKEAFRLPTGEERRYLEDGDEVILRGYCERGTPDERDYLRIGFGECRGRIVPALV